LQLADLTVPESGRATSAVDPEETFAFQFAPPRSRRIDLPRRLHSDDSLGDQAPLPAARLLGSPGPACATIAAFMPDGIRRIQAATGDRGGSSRYL